MNNFIKVIGYFIRGFLILFALLVLSVIIFVSWHRYIKFYTNPLSREFYSTLEKSNQTELDLRQLKSVEWDEFIIMAPYSDACDYQINNFDSGCKNCFSSNDDGEAYLLFLKNNNLVQAVSLNRSKADFPFNDIRQSNRYKKQNSVFLFKTKGAFPKLELKSQEASK